MKTMRAAILVLVLVSVVSVGTAQARGLRLSAPGWGSVASAGIHPGVQTFTNGAQCTANFVFYDGSHVYIGQAAHCAGTGGNTATDGCTAGVLPLGTKVDVGGTTHQGTMVYNSWVTMQAKQESDANLCAGNDFSLVQLDAADVPGNVNPSVPFWGGPVGLDSSAPAGEVVYSYGNSELRGGVTELSPKVGVSTGDDFGGRGHNVYTLSPGIPGDSGSAFLGSAGGALGVLSTLELAPLAASNNVSDLSHDLDYMHANSAFSLVQMANGTQRFSPLV